MHHSCYPGKRVLVKLHDGTLVVDRFKQKNRRHCVLENHRFPWSEVRSFRVLRADE